MDQQVKVFLSLASAAVNQTAPDPMIVKDIDLDTLFRLASFHQMTAVIATALDSAGISDDRFAEEQARAIRKNMILDYERSCLTPKLEANGIWYMPLKGIILKEYYPGIGMRQMSDNDILFDASRADDVRSIMEDLGFTTVEYGKGHQDDYQKPPVSNFEMHRMLFSNESDKRLFNYYDDISDKLIPVNGCERRLSDEDFYIYLVAHEFKHYYWNGTGVRSLLDIYVFLKRFRKTLDREYIDAELKKMGIADFEKKNRALAVKIFGRRKPPLSEKQEEMLDYFITAGVFGTRQRGIQNSAGKLGTFRYILQRVFLPMEAIRKNYPYFYKHKLLIPVLPIYRLVREHKNASTEVKALRKHIFSKKK